MRRRTFVRAPMLVCAAMTLTRFAAAQTPQIQVDQVWSRAAPQGRTGALYLTVTDNGAPDRLVGVETAIADKAELHESFSDNGVMKMRPVESASVEPGKPLVLKPGGYHVMLVGLRQALKEGDSFPVTLHFAKAGAVTATARVEKAGATPPMMHDGMPMDHSQGAMHH